MISFTHTASRAGRLGAYGLTVPAVGVGVWAALLIAATDARPLAATPLALAVALGAFIAGWLLFCFLSGAGVRRTVRDREARIDAELASAQVSRVAQLTSALAQARTTRAVIEAAVQECLHAMRADAGALLLVSRDGERAEVARAVGYAQGLEPVTTKLSEKAPLSDAVGRG